MQETGGSRHCPSLVLAEARRPSRACRHHGPLAKLHLSGWRCWNTRTLSLGYKGSSASKVAGGFYATRNKGRRRLPTHSKIAALPADTQTTQHLGNCQHIRDCVFIPFIAHCCVGEAHLKAIGRIANVSQLPRWGVSEHFLSISLQTSL